MFVFLVSGLFCCLGFSGVIFFAVWARAQAPPKQEKTNTRPAQTAKTNNTTPPLPSVFFFAVWAGGCVHVFAVWAGGVLFFLLFGRGGVFFFLLFGQGRVLFLLFGRGRVLFFAVWAGGVFFFCCLGGGREFTHLPVCLARL